MRLLANQKYFHIFLIAVIVFLLIIGTIISMEVVKTKSNNQAVKPSESIEASPVNTPKAALDTNETISETPGEENDMPPIAHDRYPFRNTTWEMNIEQVKKAETAKMISEYTNDYTTGKEMTYEYILRKEFGLNEMPATIKYFFDADEKLIQGGYELFYEEKNFQDDYDTIKQDLIDRLGVPDIQRAVVSLEGKSIENTEVEDITGERIASKLEGDYNYGIFQAAWQREDVDIDVFLMLYSKKGEPYRISIGFVDTTKTFPTKEEEKKEKPDPTPKVVYQWCQKRYEYYDKMNSGYSGDKYTAAVFEDAAKHFGISTARIRWLYDQYRY
ncbi:hypothetical protein [Petroclostridium sp. X23]|uniref:hypothetical protein n=1 Tax=Petroclostridium sp. X23 TaxID=3045146 RepID=UPI0024AC932E|nr:hypothetical protein [Petroclostridium sp. X23]WHH57678.1 hypothetical protein QKW49_17855 [Petroclostridium sp. X23]